MKYPTDDLDAALAARSGPRGGRSALLDGSCLAVAGAAAMFIVAYPSQGRADPTISGPTSAQTWTSGGFTITSSGTITGTTQAISVSGSVGTLTNSGVVSGSNAGVDNAGSISALNNSGTILGNLAYGKAISNEPGATIDSLVNSVGGVLSGSSGVVNQGLIGALSNSGSIAGVHNFGTVTSLTNNSGGVISNYTGVNNEGLISTLSNSGRISGAFGILNKPGMTIEALINNAGGSISGGSQSALSNAGSIGTVVNAGTIYGSGFALYNSIGGVLGPISNTGTIAGTIENDESQALSITGGAGATIGTLTGSSGVGAIINTGGGDVVLAGNLLLNDRVTLGAGTLVNNGGVLTLNSIISVTGAYSQASGTLALGSGAKLVVSGAAVLSGGTAGTGGALSATSNYIVGAATTLVAGGSGSSYSGVVGQSSITGVTRTLSASGFNLLQTIGNDYVGGALAAVTNSGTISGQTYGLYVASTGSLGSLTNTGMLSGPLDAIYNAGTLGPISNRGTIAGNIDNETVRAVSITGGAGATIGTLTGSAGIGAIISTLGGNVVLAGNLLLNDHVSVGAGALVNNGGSLSLNSIINVAGLYRQASGTLAIGPAGGLVVSGAATLTGGRVTGPALSATGNYLAGASATLVAGGAGSTYGGLTLVSSSITGVSQGQTVSGLNLLQTISNDYVGGALASIVNSGAVSGQAYGLYVASTGNLGSLANTGMLSGTVDAIYNAGALGPVSNTGTIAGAIDNHAAQALSITGGAGATIGTLTGSAGMGAIISTLGGNVVLAGNLLLNDNLSLGSGTLFNNGGALSLNSIISVTGNFSQTAGVLAIGSGGELVVSGAAVISGGDVTGGSLSATANYLATQGLATLVAGGAGSTFSGVGSGSISITGVSAVVTVSGANLLEAVSNDYVGGALSNIVNSATISGQAYGLYVASTGALGSLSNSGVLSGNVNGVYNAGSIGSIENSGTITGSIAALANSGVLGPISNAGVIAGDIVNSSAQDLSIGGGSGASIGTLTGLSGVGAIINTLGNVVLTGGNLLLNDHVDVTGHTLVNNGAAVSLTRVISVTGAFSQASGTLALAAGAYLSVSGAASITGGTVTGAGVLSATGAYLAGATAMTLVQGGSNSSYTGVSIGSSIAGLELSPTVSANALMAAVADDYVGGSLSSLSNSGTIFGASHAVYIASTGSLGALGNAGSLIGSQTAVYLGGTLGALSNSGTISGALYALRNAGSLGPILNTGLFAGDILDASAQDLSITGGTESIFGTLTGFAPSSQGTITHTTGDLRFAGNVMLNDMINLGSHQLVNSGALQLNAPISLTGNFLQTGGLLISGVASASNYGQLIVSGSVEFSGGQVTLKPLNSGVLASGQTYTIVRAGPALNATGVTATVSGFTAALSTILSGGHADLLLTLNTITASPPSTPPAPDPTPTPAPDPTPPPVPSPPPPPAISYAALGEQAGGRAITAGVTLDLIAASGAPASQAFQAQILPLLNGLPTSAKEHALAQLSPSDLTVQLSAGAATQTVDPILQHMQSLALRDDVQLASLSDDVYADFYGDEGRRMWGKLVGGGAQRNDSQASAFRSGFYGLVFGADVYRSTTAVVGAAGTWLSATVNGRGAGAGDSSRLNSYQLTAYGSVRPMDGRLTIDGQLGYALSRYDQSRQIEFLHARAEASFAGQQYLAGVNVGYSFRGPVYRVTPYVGLREVHIVNPGYTESGAGLADVHVNGMTTDSLTHETGVRVDANVASRWGQVLPSVKLGWSHDYTNGPIAMSGSMAGVTFASTSRRPSADGAALGAGVDLRISKSLSIGVEYQGDLRSGFQSHTGALKANWKF